MRYAMLAAVVFLAGSVRAAPATQPAAAEIAELRAEVKHLEAQLADVRARLAKAEGAVAATQPAARKQATYDVPGLYKAVPAELRPAIENPANALLAQRLQAWIDHDLVGNRLRISGTVGVITPASPGGKTFTIRIIVSQRAGMVNAFSCLFPVDQIDRAAQLKEGQHIKAIGTLTHLSLQGERSFSGALADAAFE